MGGVSIHENPICYFGKMINFIRYLLNVWAGLVQPLEAIQSFLGLHMGNKALMGQHIADGAEMPACAWGPGEMG